MVAGPVRYPPCMTTGVKANITSAYNHIHCKGINGTGSVM